MLHIKQFIYTHFFKIKIKCNYNSHKIYMYMMQTTELKKYKINQKVITLII
jgi:hypothetical protein